MALVLVNKGFQRRIPITKTKAIRMTECSTDVMEFKQRLFGEIKYTAETWDHERRVIMKAERLPAGPNSRFIVTNLKGRHQALYDENYVKRGDMENRIKEQQLMLFADRTSCHDFEAMRHSSITTTMNYYVDLNAENVGDVLRSALGNKSGNIADSAVVAVDIEADGKRVTIKS